MDAVSRPRAYDNSGRVQAAADTRRRILDTARTMLLDGGYHSMSVAGLASAAGVSPQTVYNAVGGKAEVVKAVYDVLLAGDEDPVPMSSRPEFLAMGEAPDRASFGRAYAAFSAGIWRRVGPLLGVLLADGPGNDATLAAFVATIDGERLTGNTQRHHHARVAARPARWPGARRAGRRGLDPHRARGLRPVRAAPWLGRTRPTRRGSRMPSPPPARDREPLRLAEIRGAAVVAETCGQRSAAVGGHLYD